MIRCEIHVSSEIHDIGPAEPALVLQLRHDGPLTDYNLRGRLVITGVDRWRLQYIESELVRRLHGRATLSLGPLAISNILDGENISAPLRTICRESGWTAQNLADKADLTVQSIRCALAGQRVRAETRLALARLINRMIQNPTPGEQLRRYRIIRKLDVAKVAERCCVSPLTVSYWETDHEEVPEKRRAVLTETIGLPPGVWPDEPQVSLLAAPVSVGQEIKRVRREAGLSQRALALAADVTRKSVYLWEADERRITKEHAILISRILHLGLPNAITDNAVA